MQLSPVFSRCEFKFRYIEISFKYRYSLFVAVVKYSSSIAGYNIRVPTFLVERETLIEYFMLI